MKLNSIVDRTLCHSIISKQKAFETKAAQTSEEPSELVDSYDENYTSHASICLRWSKEGTDKSFKETFLIVDSCRFDTMLRKDVDVEGRALAPGHYPLKHDTNSPGTHARFGDEPLRAHTHLIAEASERQGKNIEEAKQKREETKEAEDAKKKAERDKKKEKVSS